jgi:flavoprotein
MASKTYVPVYVLPCEYGFETTNTKLPYGRGLNLRIRKEGTAHIDILMQMDDVNVIKAPSEITSIFESYYS